MSIANKISHENAKELIALIDERDALQAKLNGVYERIAIFLDKIVRQGEKENLPRVAGLDPWIVPFLQSGGDGSPIGKKIFALLEDRKEEGATTDEIVDLFHRSRSSVHVWFSSAIRRNRGITRIGTGRYALTKYVRPKDPKESESPANPKSHSASS